MEFVRRLWRPHQNILMLHRLASSRIIPHRCSLNTVMSSTHSKNSPSELYQPFINRSTPTSPLPSIFHAGYRRADGRCSSLLCNNVGFISRPPKAFSAPQNFVPLANRIHTTDRLNVLFPAHVWLLIKPIQKLIAIILGRRVRKWWQALPANKRQLFRETMWRNRWKLSLSATGLGFLVILFCFTSLEETPLTGRTRLLVFRKEQFDLLTKLTYELMIEEYKDKMVPEKDKRYQQVQAILQHLINCNSDLPEVAKMEWTLHVVDEPLINATALPTGHIFVFSGMLHAVLDSNQLAFILSHEMAHIILDHVNEKASVSHLLDFLFTITLLMIWAICPMDSLAVVGQWIQSKLQEYLFMRPFSRTLETEADKVGIELAAKACFDVRSSSVFWKQMTALETLEGEPRKLEWFSTHPSHEKRAEHLDRLLPKALKIRESCDCPPLASVDPRVIFEESLKLLQVSRK